MVPPNSRLLHTIIWCYFFLMSTVHSFQYELYRRLNDTSQVWTGENGGSVIFTDCTTNAACGSNALCSERSCVCNATYYTLSSTQASGDFITISQKGICGYKQLSKVSMIFLSVVWGICGIDRCVLARNDGCRIFIGVTKGVTIGGLGVWYVVDIILIVFSVLKDANDVPMFDDTV